MIFPKTGSIDGFRDQFIDENIQSPYAYTIQFLLDIQGLPDVSSYLSKEELYPQAIVISPGGPFKNILPVGYGGMVRQIPVGIKFPTTIQLTFAITRNNNDLLLYDAFNRWKSWQTTHVNPYFKKTYATENRYNSLTINYWDRNKTTKITHTYGEVYPMSLESITLSSMPESAFTPFSVTLVSNFSTY